MRPTVSTPGQNPFDSTPLSSHLVAIKQSRFRYDDLHFTTMRAASPPELAQLLIMIHTLNRKQDRVEPHPYLSWVLEHGLPCSRTQAEAAALIALAKPPSKSTQNLIASVVHQLRPSQRPAEYADPHQVYLAFLRSTGEIIAIGGLIPDDRHIAQEEQLANTDSALLGFFAGLIVSRDHRGRGAGALMVRHRSTRICAFVRRQQRPASVYCYGPTEHSARLLVEHGDFVHLGRRYLRNQGHDEEVYRRIFPFNPTE